MRDSPDELPTFRGEVLPGDPHLIRNLVQTTGFFSEAEIQIAGKLAEETLASSSGAGYHFLFAEVGRKLLGYTCFGPIPGTVSSFDLYWIAVAPAEQHRGLGHTLMAMLERRVSEQGGTRLYAETSGRSQYHPTRTFYEQCGFQVAAVLEDFYSPGDAKVIYQKQLGETDPSRCGGKVQ